MSEVTVRVQQTPNPNSILFHVDQTVTEERMRQFNSLEEAEGAPLAQALFEIAEVESVFFMPNSVTVSKSANGDWGAITPAAEEAIRSHFAA